MLVRRADELEGRPVAMEGALGVSMRLLVGRADGAPNFAMRQFTVEPGGHTPRHSHDYEHEIFVVSGRGRLEHDGVFSDLAEGDAAFVRPNATHQFVNAGDEPFRFICLVPVTFDCGTPTPGS